MRTTTDSRYAVEATELHKSYPTGRGKPPVAALDGLSFAVEPGTVYGLLGPNGAGKSTTVKVLSTLTRPDSGTATVAGTDVAADPDGVRRSIGLVSQRPSSDPMATGRENLVLAGRIQGMNRTDATDRATWLLERFGIADAADRLVRTWSGGMARKLDVAIGLVHRPQVLFLDEPTTGLDPEARAEMWAEIGRMAGDDHMTVLLTTHYLDEADRLAHRLAIVDHGKVAVEGTPDELKTELRGDVLQVELENEPEAEQATSRLGSLPGLSAVLRDGCLVRARSDEGARVVPACLRDAGRSRDRRGVGNTRPAVARRRVPPLRRPLLPRRGGGLMSTQVGTLVRHSTYLSLRSIKALLRQPIFLVITLIQPMVWLLLFGKLFESVITIPGFDNGGSTSYLEFLTPGVIAMTALFSAMWAGTVYIDDMQRGVMDRLLASPVRRGAMMNGTLVYQSVTSIVQTVIVLLVALLAGARFDGGVVGVVVTLVSACLLTVICAALSNAIALMTRQQESLIGISQLLSLPLTFLSSAIMDPALAPGWLQTCAKYNPLDWAVVASRETLLGSPDWSMVWPRLAALTVLGIVMAAAATRAFGAYQRSL